MQCDGPWGGRSRETPDAVQGDAVVDVSHAPGRDVGDGDLTQLGTGRRGAQDTWTRAHSCMIDNASLDLQWNTQTKIIAAEMACIQYRTSSAGSPFVSHPAPLKGLWYQVVNGPAAFLVGEVSRVSSWRYRTSWICPWRQATHLRAQKGQSGGQQ